MKTKENGCKKFRVLFCSGGSVWTRVFNKVTRVNDRNRLSYIVACGYNIDTSLVVQTCHIHHSIVIVRRHWIESRTRSHCLFPQYPFYQPGSCYLPFQHFLPGPVWRRSYRNLAFVQTYLGRASWLDSWWLWSPKLPTGKRGRGAVLPFSFVKFSNSLSAHIQLNHLKPYLSLSYSQNPAYWFSTSMIHTIILSHIPHSCQNFRPIYRCLLRLYILSLLLVTNIHVSDPSCHSPSFLSLFYY